MAKQYKTLTFEDNTRGRRQMASEIDELANTGWHLQNKEVTSQGWSFGKTCCLGFIFFPLALLGKKSNIIQVIMEKDN